MRYEWFPIRYTVTAFSEHCQHYCPKMLPTRRVYREQTPFGERFPKTVSIRMQIRRANGGITIGRKAERAVEMTNQKKEEKRIIVCESIQL